MKPRLLNHTLAVGAIVLVVTFSGPTFAQESKLLLDLRGQWKFMLGDDPRYAELAFNDSKWVEISVPAPWEDQGYPGYDGYAWYRKHFTVPADWTSKDLLLKLGKVDDVDEVYVNGAFVGFSGTFPPHYITAYNIDRQYPISSSIFKAGADNVIAVRVYDSQLQGGITNGRAGLYERIGQLRVDLELNGDWRFKTGDDMKWKDAVWDDSNWKSVRVPAYWETQGFKDYDGFGWYRVRFKITSELLDQDLVLLVGRIDDFDETYLNGQRIGRTGLMPVRPPSSKGSTDYSKLRAYTIPAGTLHSGEENVLAVRVFDDYLHGGIYDGPIGFVTRDHYRHYHKATRKASDWFRELFQDIFH
jgi:sialate O-acetylesterase